MIVDTIIKNARIYTPCGPIHGGIAIDEGRIVDVASNSALPDADEVIDAQNKVVIPGLVDPHVHLGSGPPGTPAERVRDDFRTESEGAAWGGVTTFATFFASMQPYVGQVEKVITWGNENSLVDFRIHVCVQTERHIEEEPALFRLGVNWFKHFYTAYKGEEAEKAGVHSCTGSMLYDSFAFIGRAGFPALAAIHAEDQDIIDARTKEVRKRGENTLTAWSDSRPPFAEAMKIDSAARVAIETGARLYIVHLSSSEGLETVKYWKKRGARIICETCPHYLTHDNAMYDRIGVWGKVAPPLRTSRDQSDLWKAINDGIIECVGTDTVPYNLAEKEQGTGKFGDIWRVLPGFPNGMQLLLPIMLSEGLHKNRISLDTLVKVCSENSSKALGLYPTKGAILPGSDADLVIVDLNREIRLRLDDLRSRVKDWSIYDGWRFHGMPVMTMLRGKVIVREAEVVGEVGFGKFIPKIV
ncbi:MAG: amidohydrolase family protein [Candidatus Bathyarchaeia archaeon]|jgi:dihydropyrimidinase/dihydroorotase